MRIVVYQIPKQEKILYNLGKLLEKICKQYKIGILCDVNNIDVVDKTLWTISSDMFLPHEIATNNPNDNERQNVLLSCELNQIIRDVLCVFTLDDVCKILQNDLTLTTKVKDLIYITQDNDDIEKIKNTTTHDVDVFVKSQNQWRKVFT